MKISFFNSYVQGGAANAAINLFKHLDGIEKTFFYKENISSRYNALTDNDRRFIRIDSHNKNDLTLWKRIIKAINARKYYRRHSKILNNKPAGFEQFSVPNQFASTPISFFSNDPGIIHLHWIAEWIDYSSFFMSLDEKTPVVWTLHDMNAFTAGCHFASGCNQYETGCRICPQLAEDRSVSAIFRHKEDVLSRLTNLNIVTPSFWLSRLAKNSKILEHAKHHVIPNGVDTDCFFPMDCVHEKFNNDSLKVLYVSADLNNPRKGFEYFKVITSCFVDSDETIFYAVGDHILPTNNIIQLGRIDSRQELAFIYSSADVLIFTSIEDNLPNVILEALACGTPVIGFDISDLKRLNEKKYPVYHFPIGDISGIVEQIKKYKLNRINGRDWLEHFRGEYSLRNQAERYLELYRKLVSSYQETPSLGIK